MTALRDRLAEMMYVAACAAGLVVDLRPWSKLEAQVRRRWCRVALDLRTSEEWQAREAVVDAATQLDAAIYSLKREHELHADEIALHEALARLVAARGEEVARD